MNFLLLKVVKYSLDIFLREIFNIEDFYVRLVLMLKFYNFKFG